MKEFKGTKGEWIITEPEDSNGYVYIGRYGNDNRIATCYTVDFENHKGGITEETRANAKLISAAPELLEVLQETDKDLCALESTMLQIEKKDHLAEGMTKLVREWRERNKKAINKALGL